MNKADADLFKRNRADQAAALIRGAWDAMREVARRSIAGFMLSEIRAGWGRG